jgi:hypothetical protein
MTEGREQGEDERVRRIQQRLYEVLRETPEDYARSDFSEYVPDRTPALTRRLREAASRGGLDGIESALAEFARLAEHEDLVRLQHALMVFLTDSPAAEYGLRIPTLQERSPWKVLPSKRHVRS